MNLVIVEFRPDPSPYTTMVRSGPLYGVADQQRHVLIGNAVFEKCSQAADFICGPRLGESFDISGCSRFTARVFSSIAWLANSQVEIILDESETRYRLRHESPFCNLKVIDL